jgi:Protein of unknown function (DUF2905)
VRIVSPDPFLAQIISESRHRQWELHWIEDARMIYGLGRMLIGLGLLLAVVGVAILLLGKAGLPLGRLPGDLSYRGKHVSVFVPLGTSLLLSVLLSLVLYAISHWRK